MEYNEIYTTKRSIVFNTSQFITIVFMTALLIIILMLGHAALEAIVHCRDIIESHNAAGSI